MKQNSDEFLSNYSSSTREIIDYVTGIIFQTLPNVSESIISDKLKYVDPRKGSLCSIYVKNDLVMLEFRSGEKFKFDCVDLIDKNLIVSCLKN